MKKFRCLILVTFIFIISIISPVSVKADDSGYYIKDYHVNVDVNDKRQYIVTENILVHFNEDRHGIKRNIPTNSSAEQYSISDVSVENAPYEVEDNGDYVEIKIGDEDSTINGDKKYVVRYTLNHYDDEENVYDYLYLDVLGTQWDTYIENFSADINYQSQMNIKDFNVVSGHYGSQINEIGAVATLEDNKVNITANNIKSGCGITILMRFEEGAFKNAPKYNYDVIISEEKCDFNITNDKIYEINRSYNITKDIDEPIVFDISGGIDTSNVYDFVSDNSDVVLLSEDGLVEVRTKEGQSSFNISYKIKAPLDLMIDFDFKDIKDNTFKIEKLYINIQSPTVLSSPVNNYYDATLSDDKKTCNMKNKYILRDYDDFNISIGVDNNYFTRKTPLMSYIGFISSICVMIIVLMIFLKFGKDNKVIKTISFYPPNGLSSPEVAYLFKESCSVNNMTTLIFYWASHNHIRIHAIKDKKKDKDFILEKISDLDLSHQEFERTLFNKIFELGDGKSVTKEELKYKLYDNIVKSISSMRKIYVGDKVLYDKKSRILQKICLLLSIIPIIPLSIGRFQETSLAYYEPIVIIVGFIIVGIVLFFIINSLNRKNNIKTIYTCIISIISIFVLIFFIDSMSYRIIPQYITIISISMMIISIALSAFVSRKSDYYINVLGDILGFRDFLKVAEKERLEALIDEDPDYFYNTLPFAQVLGVTNVWKNKFADIEMQPPSWYYGDSYDVFNYYVLTSIIDDVNSIGKDMSSIESSNSSSGDFSGGGFSGGGSGGGGGSSW